MKRVNIKFRAGKSFEVRDHCHSYRSANSNSEPRDAKTAALGKLITKSIMSNRPPSKTPGAKVSTEDNV